MTDDFELMHSYPDFPKDAVEAFQDLTAKYQLKPTAKGIFSVNFDNQYCRLSFNMDRYDLQGLLFQKKGLLSKKTDDFSFDILSIANLISPDHDFQNTCPKMFSDTNKPARKLLFWYADLIGQCLPTVLKGDFSWYEKQKSVVLYERKLIGVILGEHIETGHPISKKILER